MLSALVIGLIVGAGYGLMALGVVLIYKASRRFNFAQGEFGTIATFMVWGILDGDRVPGPAAMISGVLLGGLAGGVVWNWLGSRRTGTAITAGASLGAGAVVAIPTAILLAGSNPGWPVAALFGLLAGVAMGLITERFVVRPLIASPPVTVLVATAGVALLVIAFQIIIGEAKLRSIPQMVEGSGISLADIPINPQRMLIVLALGVVGFLLYLFFRSPIGTALLATSQEPTAARIAGIDVNRMSMLTWGLAALFGAAAGLLFAPLDAFTPGFMTTRRLIPGFTAAVMGGMTSLPGALVGGLLVGVVESTGGYFLGQQIAGADLLGVFIALLLVLFVRPQGLLGKEA